MNPARVTTAHCRQCNSPFKLPICRVWRNKFCSTQCGIMFRKAILEYRKRSCYICAAEFIPRATQVKSGRGLYCSVKCRHIGNTGATRTSETKERMSIAQRGKFVPSGPENSRWMGGPKASYERCLKDGRRRNSVKKYRAENPHKVREWGQIRRGLKTGRLPKGTVWSLFLLQGKKCAICKRSIIKKYHVDHIQPIAKGGEHVRCNIQLLCPTCNCRKSAKEPEKFLREMGFLV